MHSANDVASVIIARNRRPFTDAMTLQKLLYYVQAWHLAITDAPLFTERIKAWKEGPVVPQVWHARREQSTRRGVTQQVGTVPLDDATTDLIDLVVDTYGGMSGAELSALTHAEQPWQNARAGLADVDSGDQPITHEAMAAYYRAHRTLGGRSAADLAAGGFDRNTSEYTPVDVDALLGDIDDPGDSRESDPWGGGNLTDMDGAPMPGSGSGSARRYTAC